MARMLEPGKSPTCILQRAAISHFYIYFHICRGSAGVVFMIAELKKPWRDPSSKHCYFMLQLNLGICHTSVSRKGLYKRLANSFIMIKEPVLLLIFWRWWLLQDIPFKSSLFPWSRVYFIKSSCIRIHTFFFSFPKHKYFKKEKQLAKNSSRSPLYFMHMHFRSSYTYDAHMYAAL